MGKVGKIRLQDAISGLVFYGRYVDDIFCLADDTTDIDDLVQKFNSAHPSLKFTAEVEAEPTVGIVGYDGQTVVCVCVCVCFAGDYALNATSEEGMQRRMNLFAAACDNLGQVINTENYV
ncbi:hypothetical protein SprV_0200824600 [Sparganum proliferum]